MRELPDLIQSCWVQIRDCLESKRRAIHDEIRNYPRPIPACDQQFNALLVERTELAAELSAAEEACAECVRLAGTCPMTAFLATARFLDKMTKERVEAHLSSE